MVDKYLNEDIIELVNNCKYIEKMKNSTVLITGATGLIGTFIVKTILECNKIKNTNIKVIAFCRDEEKFNNTFKEYIGESNLIALYGNINSKVSFKDNIDYIIHTAAITKSKMMVEFPVETTMTSIAGTNNILQLAKEKKVKSVVYLSSMEVYGVFKESNNVTEDMLGFVDLKSIRSGYPESKRVCEYLCNAYYKEFDVKVKIARLAQTFGAGAPLDDTRIFASIARSVINNENIVLKTKGLSEANYCYISDTVNAIFTLLFEGKNGESYNIVNEECHTTIKDMAEMVCHELAEDKIKVVYDIPKDLSINGYAPDTKMKLSGEKLRLLGWCPKYDLKESYQRLINSYKERMK